MFQWVYLYQPGQYPNENIGNLGTCLLRMCACWFVFVYTIIKYMKIYEEENKEIEDREHKKLTMVWP